MATRTKKTAGLPNIKANIDRAIAAIRNGEEEGLLFGANAVRIEAQSLVPVLDGDLKESAYVVAPTLPSNNPGAFKGEDSALQQSLYAKAIAAAFAFVTAKSVKVNKMVALGFSAPYARFVHEYPLSGAAGYPRPWRHSPTGQWKYLETPVKAIGNDLRGFIRKSVRSRLRG